MPSDLSSASYISLETYKKDGTPVRTPVWLVADGATVFVRTDPNSGKVKRIRKNHHVKLAPSDMRGNVKGAWVEGEARFVEGDAAQEVLKLFSKKYRTAHALLTLTRRLRGNSTLQVIAIELQPRAAN